MKRIVILGAAESGVGAAILAQKEGFDVFVKEGDKLKRGDKILAFNMKYIKENAASDAIPIVFTDNNDIRLINGSAVYKANEDMLEIETE